MKEHTKSNYKYTGAIHIHSIHSDGSGDIFDISKAAKQAGLSWIIVSDHNNFDIQEGFYNGVTVIKGEEISPDDSNHYLALDIDRYIDYTNDARENVNNVRKNGGFGFAAHPDEADNRKNKYLPIKWTDKNIVPDGVEIWNWFSQWGDNYNSSNIFTDAYAYLFRNRLVTKPYRVTLEWWDKLNNSSEKIVPAIGGIDAHALKVNYIIPLTIFSYKSMFKTILNEICLKEPLAKDFETRKKQILNALFEGRNIIFNRTVFKNSPEVYITNGQNIYSSGDTVFLNEKTYLKLNCNKISDIKVYKDSVVYFSCKEKTSKIQITEKGKYRIEAEIGGFGYAYSNPIIVK